MNLGTNNLVDSNHNRIRKWWNLFDLVSKYEPSGDHPQAIEKLVKGFEEGKKELNNTS